MVTIALVCYCKKTTKQSFLPVELLSPVKLFVEDQYETFYRGIISISKYLNNNIYLPVYKIENHVEPVNIV